jgi:HK97 family phage major capsid protein
MAVIFKRHADIAATTRAEQSARSSKSFSMSRLVSCMLDENARLDGYEAEVAQELARAHGVTYDPRRVVLPVQLMADPTLKPDVLARDLGKAPSSAGGYLVGTQTAGVLDLLRPWSLAAKAGATIIPAMTPAGVCHNLVIPRTDSGMTAYWVDGDNLTPSDPSLGDNIVLSQKTGGALTKFSRTLARQGDVADAWLQREMLATVGGLLDKAIFTGTGANGQPRGIANTAGIAATSGAFVWANALAIEAMAANEGGKDEHIAFATTPDVRKLLKAKTLDAGNAGEPLWKSAPTGEQVAGRFAFVGNYAPDDCIVGGPWDDLIVALWGSPVLELNPYENTDFRTGMIQARMFIDCDVAVGHPAAWSVHTSVT